MSDQRLHNTLLADVGVEECRRATRSTDLFHYFLAQLLAAPIDNDPRSLLSKEHRTRSPDAGRGPGDHCHLTPKSSCYASSSSMLVDVAIEMPKCDIAYRTVTETYAALPSIGRCPTANNLPVTLIGPSLAKWPESRWAGNVSNRRHRASSRIALDDVDDQGDVIARRLDRGAARNAVHDAIV